MTLRMSKRALLTSWKLSYEQTKSNLPKSMILLVVVPEEWNTSGNSPSSYVIGSIVALILIGFLVHSLLKPDKF